MKKAAPTILQTEVKTQEEWDGLMQRKGLGVVDVYSKWCGPCKAIVSLFRKIRNEQEDDFLFFATAESDGIDSLADYRGKSQPTFLFYGDGQLVNVLRGCDGPKVTKLIASTKAKERKIAEGTCEREAFIDKVVNKEPEPEEKQDLIKEEDVNEAEEELVSKQVSIVIIKPDAVQGGLAEQILEEVSSSGYDILQKVERLLTKDEVAELYKQDDGDNFEQLIEFMTNGPCIVLAVSKSGDVIGEEIVDEILTLCGPGDVNTAKEEKPDSLRAKYGTDSLHNGIGCSLSAADALRELAFFFPDLELPTVKHLIQQKTLQRTVAVIRPNAFEQKDDIIKAIEDSGFLIAIQKEITFTRENAEEFYSQYKDEESFEGLILNMTSGPSFALCLVKNNAVEAWKSMLSTQENVESGAEGNEMGDAEETQENQEELDGVKAEPATSLQEKFAVPDSTCEPLHASDSVADFEREMRILFPMENVFMLIQPDTYKNEDERGAILSLIKKAGFNIVVQKEVTMSDSEQVQFIYKGYAEHEVVEGIAEYMSSGPSEFLVLSREDAVDGLESLMGPGYPLDAKELSPDSLRGQFGRDHVRHAIYGLCGKDTKDHITAVIKELCSDIVFDENGLVCEPVPGIVENKEIVADANQADAGVASDSAVISDEPAETGEPTGTDQLVPESGTINEEGSTEESPDTAAAEGAVGEAAVEPSLGGEQETVGNEDPPADNPTSNEPTDDSSAPTSREATTDGPTESSSTEVSREGTLNETDIEQIDTATSAETDSG